MGTDETTPPAVARSTGTGARLTSRPFDPDTVLEGDRVRLRPVRSDDVAGVHRLAMAQPAASRWRFHGMLASADEFARTALGIAALNTVVERRSDGSLVGFGQCAGTDLRHGHSSLWAIVDPAAEENADANEGVDLLRTHAFSVLPVQRLTVSLADVEVDTPTARVLVAGFTHEGTLRRHVLVDGARRDLLIYGITRDECSG